MTTPVNPSLSQMLAAIFSVETYNGNWTDYMPVYYSHLPDNPDEAAAVFDTVGELHGRDLANGETFENPGFHIQVRSSEVYRVGWEKINSFRALIDSVSNYKVKAGSQERVIRSLTRRTSCLYIGFDSSRRNRQFTVSGVAAIRDDDSVVTRSYRYEETPAGTVNGTNTVFTLEDEPHSIDQLMLTLIRPGYDVTRLHKDVDFTLDGNEITVVEEERIPQTGDLLQATYRILIP